MVKCSFLNGTFIPPLGGSEKGQKEYRSQKLGRIVMKRYNLSLTHHHLQQLQLPAMGLHKTRFVNRQSWVGMDLQYSICVPHC